MKSYKILLVIILCLLSCCWSTGCKKSIDLSGQIGNDSSTIQNFSGVAALCDDQLYYRESAGGQLCCYDTEQNKIYKLTTSLGGARDINATSSHVFYRDGITDGFRMTDYAGRNESTIFGAGESVGFAQVFDNLVLGIEARPGPIFAFKFSTNQQSTLYDARVNRFALDPSTRVIYTIDVVSTEGPVQTKLRRFNLDQPSSTLETAELKYHPAVVAVNDSHLIIAEIKPFGLHEYHWVSGEDTELPVQSEYFALCGDSLFYLQNGSLFNLNLKTMQEDLLVAENVECFAVLQEYYLFYSTDDQRDWYSEAPFEKFIELKSVING